MAKKDKQIEFEKVGHSINNMDDVHYKQNPPPQPKKRTDIERSEANFVNTLRINKSKSRKE